MRVWAFDQLCHARSKQAPIRIEHGHCVSDWQASSVWMFCAIPTATAVAHAGPSVQASASIQILRAVSSSEESWRSPSARHRVQRFVREADGRLTVLRIIDHE